MAEFASPLLIVALFSDLAELVEDSFALFAEKWVSSSDLVLPCKSVQVHLSHVGVELLTELSIFNLWSIC